MTECNTDQEILWLDVAVYDVERVKIAECEAEVVDHTARVFLAVLACLGDRIKQIAALYYRMASSLSSSTNFMAIQVSNETSGPQ